LIATNLLTSPNCFLSSGNTPASIVFFLNLSQASPNILICPVYVLAISSDAPIITAVPSLNAFMICSLVCAALYLTPSSKPKSDLTPFSLNKSAAAIPPANDLCNCSAVCWKLNPVAAAMSPVIFITSFNSSAPSVTVNSNGADLAISSKAKGTVLANFVKLSNAAAPSSALPVKNFNWIPKFSKSTAVFKNDLATLRAPNAATAPTTAPCNLENAELDFLVEDCNFPIDLCT